MVDSASLPWNNDEPCILGIDEAGRGPVLGPMVYSAAYCPKSSEAALNSLGANDSKQLTEVQRDALRAKIDSADFIASQVRVLSAEELSAKMLRRVKYNLNLISHDTALALVQAALDHGANITEIYVDTVGDPKSYEAKFRNRFPLIDKVVVAKKADSTYKIVAAASIVAKTTRDKQIRDWVYPEVERSCRFQDGDPNAPVTFPSATGSGYPGDPATKAWMAGSCDPLFGFPTFVRFSWGTTKTILDKKAVDVDWESDEEEEEKSQVKTKNIKSFFSAKPVTISERPSKTRKTSVKTQSVPKLLKSMSLKRVSTLL